jgi:hypothetical protein
MLPKRTRLIATAALGAVLVAGCSGTEPTAGPGPTTVVPPSTAQSSTPTPTPTPTPKPTPNIAGLSAGQIVKKAEAAAKAATGVRVRGTMTMDDGKLMKLDVSLAKTAGSGTMSVDGARMSVIVIGRIAYLKGDEAFWRQGAKKKDADQLIKLLRGKWLKVAMDEKGLGEMAAFASKAGFFDGMFTAPGSLRKTAAKTVDGVRCIGLGGADGTLWVDATTARPIRIEPGASAPTEGLSFSEYNQVKQPKAPPRDQVVDGKTLGL